MADENKERHAELERLTALLVGDPENTDALWDRASLRAALGDNVGALADYTTAMRLLPEEFAVASGRAHVHDVMGDHRSSLADIEDALRRHELHSVRAGKGADPRVVAELAFDKAYILYRLGEKDAALEQVNVAVKHDPGQILAWGLKWPLEGAVNPAEKLKPIDLALELMPEDARLHYLRAVLLREQDNLVEALAALETAIWMAPFEAEYRMERADILLIQNRHADALADCNQVIETDPEHAYAYATRAYVFAYQKRWTEMLEDVASATKLARGDAHVLYATACALGIALKLGNPDAPGVKNKCLELLGAAQSAGWSDAEGTIDDPDLESLRESAEFKALVAKMADTPERSLM